MRVAREGYPFIGIAAVLMLAGGSLALMTGSSAAWVAAVALAVLAAWVVYFFRDPERAGERGDDLVIAPADGRIVHIMEVDEPAFLRARSMRISIFMNVFNVHVNRYPVSGTVRYVHYNPGKFLNAATEKSSLENEQMSVGLEHGGARILVRQIAGLIARRIVTYSRDGEVVEQADRMGIIRFGSRVDVFLPMDAQLRVQVGQATTAGTTVLAALAGR